VDEKKNFEKAMRSAIRNPRHISGVHNYCDRWCERCPFTLRCSVYAVGEAMGEGRAAKGEDLWQRLETARALAKELLAKHGDHAGVGLEKEPIFKMHERPVDSHPTGVAAKRYMEFTHGFVKKHGEALAAMAAAPGVHAVSAAEAFEVVNTYHMLLTVKLSRALSWDEVDEEMANDPELADMPRDQDGSAKLALILIDRSILAWAVLMVQAPEHKETALSAMLTLNRLRPAVEKAFPNAHKFVRPGFDTVKFPGK
jgi:hypothetical protein